jgi:hypothetical protein
MLRSKELQDWNVSVRTYLLLPGVGGFEADGLPTVDVFGACFNNRKEL